MKKLLSAALAVLCVLIWTPALAQIPMAYQAQVGNRTVIVPVTALNPLPTTGGGGGGGGGAVTVADGADVAQGTTTDAACATDNGNCDAIQLFKRNNQRVTSLITALGSPFQAGGSIGNTAFGVNAQTTGGMSGLTFEVAASDNHQVVKNGAGTWYGFDAWSKHSAALYIRFYDLGTGFNGCNSATGLIWEGSIPANSTPANGAGLVRPFGDVGRAFSTGLAPCVTAAFGSTDTTSATASVASVNVGYK